MKGRRNDDGYDTCSNSSGSADGQDGDEDARRLARLFRGVNEGLPDDFDALVAAAPDWIDPDRVRRGQAFAMDNYSGVSFSEAVSLYVLFAISRDGLDTLIATRRSDTPYRAYRRYYATADIVRSWLQTDILTPGTEGHENLRKVFRMHRKVDRDLWRHRLSDGDGTESAVAASAAIEPVCWCPALSALRADMVGNGGDVGGGGGGGGDNGDDDDDDDDDDPVSVDEWPEEAADEEDDGRQRRTAFNQCHMSVTQFGFFGLALAHPDRFGLHGCRRRDLEDFVHLWRTIGYYTGVADEYNFGRGTVEEVADRSRWLIRTLVVPRLRSVDGKWEHMCRCATEGLRAYMRRAMPFDAAFCYLCDVIGLDVPRFRSRLGVGSRLRLWWTAFMMRYAFRCGWFKRRINRLVLGELKRAAAEFGDERVQDKLQSRVYFDQRGCSV